LKIQILGSGCTRCNTLEQKVRSLNEEHALNHEIEKVTDIREIVKYGILSTPGLVVDGVVLCAGSIPKDEQLLAWMKGTKQ
jgi:small redox-active disulfide protein 2